MPPYANRKRAASSFVAPKVTKRRKAAKAVVMSKSLATRVRGLLKSVEQKAFGEETSLTPTTTPQALATGANFWDVVQGDTDSTRDGKKILVNRFLAFGHLVASVAQTVRLYLILDKQSNGAEMVPSSIFKTVPGGDTNISFHAGIRVGQENQRYVILAAKTLTFTAGELNKTFRLESKRKIDVRYDANAGAVTDLTSNNVQLCYSSLGSTATCTGPIVTQFWYTDD